VTRHVTLRRLTIADTEVAARWGEDPDFCASAGWTVDRPTADRARLWRELVTHPQDDMLRLAARDDAGDLVGYVDLMGLEPGRRELGYLVGSRAHWGHGWGTAVASAGLDHGFAVLGLGEVWAEALDANGPSVRILRRLGMTETGRGDDGTFLGRPTYYRRFAITRETWARGSVAGGATDGH
jgi:RimJ/RimL family protein N-acetyltransferase